MSTKRKISNPACRYEYSDERIFETILYFVVKTEAVYVAINLKKMIEV